MKVVVTVPVRVGDVGGWTDTWFAGRGVVCSVACRPGAVARVTVGAPSPHPTCDLHVPSFSDRYAFPVHGDPPERHPLLEAAVRRFAPAGVDLRVEVSCAVPPGSGVGTSAAVCVALVAALLRVRGEPVDPAAVAAAAHAVETVDLGMQSGVQDQVAAAFGGVSRLDVDPYPTVRVRPLDLSPATWDALERRTITAYLGRPHRSDELHRRVIAGLEADRALAERLLAPLRDAAVDAVAALEHGDVDAWAEAMVRNTEAQRALHPALVGPAAEAAIGAAAGAGAVGWKVNGAGGDGGSVTVVAGDEPERVIAALEAAGCTVLALRPSREGIVVKDR